MIYKIKPVTNHIKCWTTREDRNIPFNTQDWNKYYIFVLTAHAALVYDADYSYFCVVGVRDHSGKHSRIKRH